MNLLEDLSIYIGTKKNKIFGNDWNVVKEAIFF